MELVKIVVLSLAACSLATGADFGIDIGSPVAAATKVKAAVFSVRTHGCSGDAKFSGVAKEATGHEEPLNFVAGAPGTYAVARYGRTVWFAVITADCNGTKVGAVVPVDAQNLYQRDAIKLYSHAPTTAEVDETLKKLQGGSR